MKKIALIIMVLGLVGMLSCKKDETKATLKSSPGTPVLDIPGGDAMVLKLSDKDVVLTYAWTMADYGVSVVTNYTLQIDKQGSNFSNALSLGLVTTSKGGQLTTTIGALNAKLITLVFDPKNPDPLPLEFRIRATISDSVKPVYSTSVKQTITPYYVKVVYPLLFVPGSYQGWNPADSTTSIASVKSNDMYEGYIWFGVDNAQFKYCQGPAWTTNWGDNGATGTLVSGGANIVAGTAGYYKLNVDLTGLKHTFLRTAWSVIGDATPGGWNTDTDMAYDSIGKVWTVTVALTKAAIKFRANHGWDLNYGDDAGNGSLNAGGANINVPEGGNYTITLNLSQPVYKYKLVKN